MKLIWSILCQRHTTNLEDNLMNLFGCITNIFYSLEENRLKDINVIPTKIELVTCWIVEDEEKDDFLEYKIDFIDPDGNKLETDEKKIEILKDRINFRDFHVFDGIKFSKEGTYIFRIHQKEAGKYKKVYEIPLKIKLLVKEKGGFPE